MSHHAATPPAGASPGRASPTKPQQDGAAAYLIVLGLGANLGDRLASLRKAAEALEGPGLKVTGRSEVFETPPAGGPAQPHYLNAAIRVETSLTPQAVLGRALAIERALGRQRPDPVRWGPRTIDIDWLWSSRGVVSEPGLSVPHPRLHERPFALIPLLQLVPNACDAAQKRYRDLPTATERLRSFGPL